jgi:hypothetical protein
MGIDFPNAGFQINSIFISDFVIAVSLNDTAEVCKKKVPTK